MQTSPSDFNFPAARDFEFLTAKVEQLEKQNRRFKRGGMAVLLASVCLFAMGQARQNTALGAQSFVLRDASGSKRAELALESESPRSTPTPTLRFFDEKGNQTLFLSSTRLELAGQSDLGTNILLDDAKGVARANLGLLGDQSFALLNDAKGTPRVRVDLDHGQPKIDLQDADEIPRVGMAIIKDLPTIGLDDPQGFSAVLGSTSVVTAGSRDEHQTPAASLMLFGKDGNVLFSAP
jgi:hypothetical protein